MYSTWSHIPKGSDRFNNWGIMSTLSDSVEQCNSERFWQCGYNVSILLTMNPLFNIINGFSVTLNMFTDASGSIGFAATYKRAISLYTSFMKRVYKPNSFFPTPQKTVVTFLSHLT